MNTIILRVMNSGLPQDQKERTVRALAAMADVHTFPTESAPEFVARIKSQAVSRGHRSTTRRKGL